MGYKRLEYLQYYKLKHTRGGFKKVKKVARSYKGYYNGLQGVAVWYKGLDRGYYTVARRYEFYFRVAKE